MAKTRAQRITSLNNIIDDALTAIENSGTSGNAGADLNTSGQGASADHTDYVSRQQDKIDRALAQIAALGGVAEVTSEAIG